MIPKYYFGMSEDVLLLALLYSLFITYRNYKVYLDMLIFVAQDQLEELRMKMGATLSERYTSTQKGTAKMMTDYEKMRKDLMKVQNWHCT